MNIAGALDGFEGQANYISGRLDDLNKQKEEFLSEHGSNQSTWSEEELKQFDKLENRMLTPMKWQSSSTTKCKAISAT